MNAFRFWWGWVRTTAESAMAVRQMV
jgi:hypothetical protein